MSLGKLSLTENCPVEQQMAETRVIVQSCSFAEDFCVLNFVQQEEKNGLEFPVGGI